MGDNRKKVYYRIKEIGYDFISYISTRANVYTDRIGDNVIILEGNTLQPFVQIGSNVSIWSNNHLGHHSTIESHATITSHVVISGNCKIGENCFLGVNSSIADHVRLGNYTFVGAGTTVTKNTTEGSVLATSQSEARKIDSRRLRY
jgi:UDP-3-O-[3-hydroxymyristoyl] glucosamine N-acyltransferase